MSTIPIEQALYFRPDRGVAQLVGRSPGFADGWLQETERLILGFGDRPAGMRCPLTVFAQPFLDKRVAIVRVRDEKPGEHPNTLLYHFLIVEKSAYEAWIRDPFILCDKIAPVWTADESLPALNLPASSFRPRKLAEVQEVLKRIKAGALNEGEDPEALDFERTMENSESPALLGGAQVLVDGGRLVFERPAGDLRMASGLWLLLPEVSRRRLWPASFAFSSELDFDLLVLPGLDDEVLESYTTEEQAADYPQGAYELALQRAVEQGTQADLDAVFSRRDSRATIRLALIVLAIVSALVLISRFVEFGPSKVQTQKAAAAAGIVVVGEPWTALGMLIHGDTIWKPAER